MGTLRPAPRGPPGLGTGPLWALASMLGVVWREAEGISGSQPGREKAIFCYLQALGRLIRNFPPAAKELGLLDS